MNLLHNALSPYLLQHSENPVHWQPWDDAAFAQAAREKKPILLSIGYAACHWCHVMAHESFADADTAALMNAHFINIKVDREERPDIDRIYQSAHYLFTRHNGGWPLTMFLTPQGEPFFGGTYFPKTARPGLPSFTEVLTRVTTVWQRQQDAVKAQNAHILPLLKTLDDYQPAEGSLTDVALHAAAKKFEQLFDAENGGLGAAPKFPHPVELDFCLHYATMHNHPALVKKVHRALQTMANSGLCDQLGGGFFRYCTDAAWSIPHFEKMLYDNGLLLALYAQAGAVLDDEQLQNTAAITANWALRAMRTEQGVFYASQDADSVEGEGAFYLWSEPELQQILTAEEYKMVAAHYGINSATPRVEGRLHLMRQHTVAETAAITQTTSVYCAEQLAVAGEKLLRQRQTRPIPPIDDKILTAWNALMCRGLAVSGRLQQNEEWLNAAKCGINHLYEQMRKNGRTLAVCRGTRYGEKGFLDDVAFLLDAILELLRADFSAPLFMAADSLAEELCTHYYDEAQGGFFFTPHDDEALIRRLKISDDNATPSGNGVACRALLLLYQLSGDIRWRAAAEKTLLRFKDIVHKQPTAHASLASALQYYLTPPTLVYLTGEAALCRQWQQALEKNADAGVVVFYQPPSIRTDPRLPAQMIKKAPQVGAYAYLCDDKQCNAPLTTLAEVQQRLAE